MHLLPIFSLNWPQDTEEETSCSAASTAFRQEVAANGHRASYGADEEEVCDCGHRRENGGCGSGGSNTLTSSSSTCSGCSRSCSCTSDDDDDGEDVTDQGVRERSLLFHRFV